MNSVDTTDRIAEIVKLHESAFIFDGCIPTWGLFKDEDAELDAMSAGGLSGFNGTVAQQNTDFLGAMANMAAHRRLAKRRPDRLRICTKVSELQECKQLGTIGMLFHFQDSKPLDGKIDNLELFYHVGLRVLQLTYNVQGYAGTGCCEQKDSGLTYFGTELIKECHRLGILVDLSHCGLTTTEDAISQAERPISLTHTCAYALCPAQARNKPDELLKGVAETGGVIGVAFFPPLVKRNPETHEVLQADVDDVIDHIDYIVSLVGIDHVGIGSDLSNYYARILEMPADSSIRWYRTLRPDVFGSGSGDQYDPFPTGLDSHAKFRNLTAGLVKRGYDSTSIHKILGENWLRLLGEVVG